MATQNLFEKYGIKEVADVTFYRIEKKEETYESQRRITMASVLKGALELRTVYPMEGGVGAEDGFEAYVFTDADIITGANYDCDDEIELMQVITGSYTVAAADRLDTAEKRNVQITGLDDTGIVTAASTIATITEDEAAEAEDSANLGKIITDVTVAYDASTRAERPISVLETNGYTVTSDNAKGTVRFSGEQYDSGDDTYTYNVKIVLTGIIAKNVKDSSTGANKEGSYTADQTLTVGTHEYTYAQQALMLFARRQNLITKTGVRYQFKNSDTAFGEIVFNDNFAAQPYSTEKIVVAGIAGNFSESGYDLDEVNEAIRNLTDTIEAKAYNVVYSAYAELVVEDEMGYYRPDFLGHTYNRKAGKITAFNEGEYKTWAESSKGVDRAIANAIMWGRNEHWSINDAIDALKQKKLTIDAGEADGAAGINKIFGGYQVADKGVAGALPDVTREDTEYGTRETFYQYGVEGNSPLKADGKNINSFYTLEDVENALEEISQNEDAIDKDLRVDVVSQGPSNRAIYVRVDGAAAVSGGAFLYLLHNKNFHNLANDADGIFSFEDKKGNTLYYQDKIFKGIEWLALVVIGNKGLIFVVNRHGESDINRVAWMVNENGYVDDRRTKVLVKRGLIHTTDIIANDETFEATCVVKSLGVRKVTKKTNHYVPVLFLDTLKVSTIEQTAEEVYAQGGKGNANLIGWDYGKEITLTLQDALFTPASMSAIFGSYEGNDFRKGVKEVKSLDRMEKCTAKRNFIVPAGNSNGTPTEADKTAQAVYYDPATMEPYPDGTPIVEGEVYYKFTRSVAYEGQSLGHMIEISADSFPGTYKVVGDTFVRSKETGEDERFQFVIPQAKMTSEQTITLEADGDPSVFDMNMTVLRPDDGVMVKFIQYNVVENEEENDGSTMVKDTENLNLLDDAELFKVSGDNADDDAVIGATEY